MSQTIQPESNDTAADRLSYDEIFSICGNQRRRYALEYLEAEGGSAPLADLARTVAMEETGTPVDELSQSERKSVYNSLYQTHVPQLERQGIVAHDGEANVVKLAAGFEQVEPYIGGTDRAAEPRSAHYFGLSMVGGVLLALDSLHFVSVVPNATWPALLVLLFSLLTLAYARDMVENPLRRIGGFRDRV